MDKALIIGINAYPKAPLCGCVNDARDVYAVLTSRYGFAPSSIRLLLDWEATTKRILDEMAWLVDGVGVGDRVLLHHSCHGATVPALPDHTNIGGLDNVICPVDFDWSNEHMIRDDDLRDIFRVVPEGALFNWTADSCHSGHLDRGLSFIGANGWRRYSRPRSYPMLPEVMAEVRKRRAAGCKPRTIQAELPVGFAAGCAFEGTCADTVDESGRPCGAFTHYFLQSLADEPKASLSGIVKDAAADMFNAGYDQTPLASGLRSGQPFLEAM